MAFVAPSYAATSTTSLSTSVTERMLPINVGGTVQKLAYCGNGDIAAPSGLPRSVILVVHGDSRDACGYASTVLKAVPADRRGSTLVVAPHFVTATDTIAQSAGVLYWSADGWKKGDLSESAPYPRNWQMSSFEAMDRILVNAMDQIRFPNVSSIRGVGHSAGGQFVNRYLATSQLDVATLARASWIVSAPSSYLYLDNRRVVSGAIRALSSTEQSACKSFDTYKYGLQGRSGYVAVRSSSDILSRVSALKVTYLVGGLDNSTTDSSLDTGCGASWQGVNRLDRASRFQVYLNSLPLAAAHPLVVVPGVGHSFSDVMATTTARSVLNG